MGEEEATQGGTSREGEHTNWKEEKAFHDQANSGNVYTMVARQEEEHHHHVFRLHQTTSH